MLTAVDEVLLHQAPLPFSEPVTSDHRFYDRCWVAAYDPAGGAALNFGLGFYLNMDVADGFVCSVRGARQRNVRASRPLRPHLDRADVGPLHYEVLVPFEHTRVRLEPTGGLACELDWRATQAVFVEAPTRTRVNGRIATDVQRYDQVGRVDGWIRIDDEQIEVRGWFGARDHSWGVRGGVGGFEPPGGTRQADAGFLVTWLLFETPEAAGYAQLNRDANGATTFRDGRIRLRDGGERGVVDIRQDIEFPAGSRDYRRAELHITDDAGDVHHALCERLCAPIVMRGAGYDGGFEDGRGLGVPRGVLVEADEYDLSGAVPTSGPNGDPVPGLQREQPVTISFDGVRGTGDLTILAIGDLPFLRLGDDR